ncbi:MAG: hypothetical protein SPK77_05620 [Lachnospiraceae bacterium]|uniref:hypothetical protein n=1 Tax=Bilifractor sp. LCP21S3_A7 TaxID=3438738 RepID=UPI002A9A3258|nr:hypothetical protein [Lachnospiraceae bacterium]
MRRGTNPLAVLLMVVVFVAAIVVALIVRNNLPASVSQFKDLIFWGIVIVIGGVGGVLIGKNMNKR